MSGQKQQTSCAIHIIGDAFVDSVCYLKDGWPASEGGDSTLRQPVTTYAGGSAVNTTTHLSSLIQQQQQQPMERQDGGAVNPTGSAHKDNYFSHVTLHTVLNPNDQFGVLLLTHANKHGFQLYHTCPKLKTSSDPDCTVEIEEATGHCIVIVSSLDRSFLSYTGVVEHMDPSMHIDWSVIYSTKYSNAAIRPLHVHVAGFYNLRKFWHGSLERKLEWLRQEERQQQDQIGYDKSVIPWTTVSLVPQHDASHAWDGGIDQIVPYLDFLILNEVEANGIYQRHCRQHPSVAISMGEQQKRAAENKTFEVKEGNEIWHKFLHGLYALPSSSERALTLIVTMGAQGAVALRGGIKIADVTPAIPAKHVVDPTGAGDAFAAGFLHGLWEWYGRQQQQQLQDVASASIRSSHPAVHSSGSSRTGLVPSTTPRPVTTWPPQAVQHALMWGCAVGTASVAIPGASNVADPGAIRSIWDQQEEQMRSQNSMLPC